MLPSSTPLSTASLKEKRFQLLIEFNLWAIFLDCLGIGLLGISALLAVLLDQKLWLLPGILAFLSLGYHGFRIHVTTDFKMRSFLILLARNRRGVRLDTFRPFLGSPCGRIVVRAALRELGAKAEYARIKKNYEPSFCGLEEVVAVQFIPAPKE